MNEDKRTAQDVTGGHLEPSLWAARGISRRRRAGIGASEGQCVWRVEVASHYLHYLLLSVGCNVVWLHRERGR